MGCTATANEAFGKAKFSSFPSPHDSKCYFEMTVLGFTLMRELGQSQPWKVLLSSSFRNHKLSLD